MPARFCLMLWFLVRSSEGQVNITAELGEDVILPCEAPNTNKPIIVVEWSKPEVDQEYVFLYRDGHLDSVYQLPSYRNRVDLQDRQMKDGDVSLVLKDVKKNDTGTYECRVFQRGTNRKKRSNLQTDPIITIYLLVLEPGDKDGGDKDGGDKVGIIVGIIVGPVVGVMILLAGGFLIYKSCMRQKSHLPVPPDEAAD
ncbi:programmed cell death 1 ligand 1-like isoform X2 [Stegastes partitus]|uniref:Programmed cell death 1 ligand 1-like isoform X2 n=1 Tax=Stegastes partitus TaxID=144197 RepID=A0A9Y4NGQ5_9TELE|nr:PREDICTED: programmed cell death 1 ligand 1-like isoform X2 [Stegastes partitus]